MCVSGVCTLAGPIHLPKCQCSMNLVLVQFSVNVEVLNDEVHLSFAVINAQEVKRQYLLNQAIRFRLVLLVGVHMGVHEIGFHHQW